MQIMSSIKELTPIGAFSTLRAESLSIFRDKSGRGKKTQPRSQGLSSLHPLSLRKRPLFRLVTCLPESGKFTKCVLGEGWPCRLCRNQHAIDFVARSPSTKRLTAVFLCTTHTEFDVKGKMLWSNRSDATENMLASFTFSPV